MNRLPRSKPLARGSGIKRTPFGEKVRVRVQSEREFQDAVIQLAQYLGWWPWHPYYAQRSPKGYPDLTLFRERVIFAELKVKRQDGRTGKLTPEQIEMAHRCYRAGAEHYVWYPSDWTEIEDVLTRGGAVTVQR